MKTMTLTMEQIKDIFRAGINRGQSEASAFEWGCLPSGRKFDDLKDALEEIVNADKEWNAKDRVSFETIEEWIGELK